MGKFRMLFLCVCVFLRADIANHGLQFQFKIRTQNQTSEMFRFLVLYIVCLLWSANFYNE